MRAALVCGIVAQVMSEGEVVSVGWVATVSLVCHSVSGNWGVSCCGG